MAYQKHISVCMIIKNEEKHLDKCLSSLIDYFAEIIIVDTGSEDSSKQIARKYTDEIYDFKWCDDFSKARNYSISKATNDWVLVLDADEVLKEIDISKVKSAIESKDIPVGRIKIVNLFEENNEIRKSISYVSRLFNRQYFEYEGVIHEQIVSKDNMKYKMEYIGIEVEHFGYLDNIMIDKDKINRNISLLNKVIKDNPKDSYYHYQLGKSYYKSNDYISAEKSFQKALMYCYDFNYEYAEDMVVSYGYTLLKSKQYKKSRELEDYRKKYNNSADYNFLMGLIYMNNGEFEKAIMNFKNCIGSKESSVEGLNSYQANYNIGVIYEMLGKTSEAIKYYKKCGNYELALEGLNRIKQSAKNIDTNKYKDSIRFLVQQNNLSDAKSMLNEYKTIKSSDSEIYAIESVIYIMENNYKKAEEILLKGLELDAENYDLLYNIAYLYNIMGTPSKAIKYYKNALSNASREDDIIEVKQILLELGEVLS